MAAKLARRAGETGASLQPGSVIAGKYRIERVLGEGGMGVVYAAHHELLDQRVALKVLYEDAMRDDEASARFLQEARSAARLQSEHVARVMGIEMLENGVPFIVMEYLDGSDLGEELERKRVFPSARVVDYAMQALEAISQAHAQGIIHRDLKPSNLFLATVPDGSQIIKVLDFGISKPTFGGSVSKLTTSRSLLGSPPYMSPEQLRSPRSVDARTDIWSIGVVLYELLTRSIPFAGQEIGELFVAILEREPLGVRASRPDVPPGLEQVIFRCLAKNREERYADVAELARALLPFGTGEQHKSVDKIVSTLLRAEELSNPRRLRPVTFDNTTVPDDMQLDVDVPAPELSPTASTVARRRTLLTFVTKTKLAAFLGGGIAALGVIVVGVVVLAVGQRGAGSPAPVAPPRPPETTLLAPAPALDTPSDIVLPAAAIATAISPLPVAQQKLNALGNKPKIVPTKPTPSPAAKLAPPPASQTAKAEDELHRTLKTWP